MGDNGSLLLKLGVEGRGVIDGVDCGNGVGFDEMIEGELKRNVVGGMSGKV